jgi:hypothetical protein
VTLPAPDPLGMSRTYFHTRRIARMTRRALFPQLQCVGNRRRCTGRGAASLPRTLRKAGEARGDEQRLYLPGYVALAAASHRADGGLVAMRRRGRDAHAIDDRAIVVVAGHAGLDGRVVRNRRGRTVVGAPVRPLTGGARDSRHRPVASTRCGRTEREHDGGCYTRCRRTAHFL